jgi:hypothetical protein
MDISKIFEKARNEKKTKEKPVASSSDKQGEHLRPRAVVDEEQKEEDIKQYYKTFDLKKVKDKKNVKDELIVQLYKKPKETVKTKMKQLQRNDTHQLDLLYLPHDNGYKYALVGVDVGSRLCDAEPLKARSAKDVLTALKKMYTRKILSQPIRVTVDSGSEFKDVFRDFFEKEGVYLKVSAPNRHRQTGLVEARNKSIGTYLLKRMVAEELKTGNPSTEWVDELPKIVKRLNKRFEIKNPKPSDSTDLVVNPNVELLDIGSTVRYPLDRPIDVVTKKPVDKKFRAGDPKMSLKPVKIVDIRLSSSNPPLYKLDNGVDTMYTGEALLKVDEANVKAPPASVQKKFVVEKIVGKRKHKGKIEYLIKWKDYPDSDNTYEPYKKLVEDGFAEMIDDFNKTKKTK